MSDVRLYHGDCLEIMPTLEANSVDTIITDPPYGLEFMGKDWDYGVPGVAFWEAALRVAKPGATLLAFGGTRTHHRLMVAIENAGWEIVDVIMWVYGQGFPKSHNISKAIDKAAGAEREVVEKRIFGGRSGGSPTAGASNGGAQGGYNLKDNRTITAPATPEAETWDGYGTALKPAYEPVIVAQKPRDGTYANNALTWGVAGLWIDGARVGASSTPRKDPHNGNLTNAHFEMRPWMKRRIENGEPLKGDFDGDQGRWPANLIHDGSPEVVAGFPETSSNSGNLTHSNRNNPNGIYGKYGAGPTSGISDTGSAARFFYCAKASKSERDAGLDDVPEQAWVQWQTANGTSGKPSSMSEGRNTKRRNHHPTVKPLKLLEYLCTLTRTPTGGVVLDPFMGSGTTGCAAALTGRDFIGIDLDQEYVEIARRRIEHWSAEAERNKQMELPL